MNVTTQGLLFDMDGVLVSSIASVNRCWRRWAVHFDVPDPDGIVIAHGMRAVEMMKTLRPDFTAEDLKVGLRYIEDMEIDDVADLEVLPGVAALLAALPPERWTIVTSATRRLMVARLKAARLPVPPRLVAGDDVTHGKPHPEPYRTGAKLLGLTSAQCIVVEDAPTGVGSGAAAGSRVLGVLGTHSAAELHAAGAQWVAPSLGAVSVTTDGTDLSLEFEPAR